MQAYAYCRVSTKEQNMDRQIVAFEKYEISAKNTYFQSFESYGYEAIIDSMMGFRFFKNGKSVDIL